MLMTVAALMLVTSLGNAAPSVSSNLDAAPPPATAPVAAPQFTQPGPPADQTIQHGAVDPRGTDALPLAVKVVSMPPMGLPRADELPPRGPQPDQGMSGLVWVAIVLGALQSLLLAAVIYFVMQATNGTRRMADAVERLLAARAGDAQPPL
jgi:hypothetical protein